MRDIVAALVAIGLLVVAASLATTLHSWRRRRIRAHDAERALGRTIVAEIPTNDDLKLFSEDTVRFYYGDRSIDKDLVTAARVLINGSPIAASVSTRHARNMSTDSAARDRGMGAPSVIQEWGEGLRLEPSESSRGVASGGGARRAADEASPAKPNRGMGAPEVIEDDRNDGIARDRWDVAIETVTGTVLVECGAIRERISQELARAVFEAVKRDVELRNK